MIKKISIVQYRKLKNLEFEFSEGINVISGTNGTCKTSLLHIISNSFKAVTRNCSWLNNPTCLEIIKKVNGITNPKIEALTKGDKQRNDPTNGHKGTTFTVEYFDGTRLAFRKHDSPLNNRYSVKPYYKVKSGESLPYIPVIYLGLSRLMPFGEYQNEDAIEDIKKHLPLEYQQEIAELYLEFTGIPIASSVPQKMGDIKIRANFSSDISGIDSNTISAGEDNLFILITAIVSLKYYFDSIQSSNHIESILLIDELDATLHPSLQFRILALFQEYASKYKIQIVFTTHSLSLLEFTLKKRDNVIYLIDNVTDVVKMLEPDIYKIKMFLYDKTRDDIYTGNVIPVFTEDNEARIFLNTILDYFKKSIDKFATVSRFFHLIDANIGAKNLKSIFSDTYLLQSTMRSICILDGDQKSQQSLENYIISLPGGASPEKMIMEYSIVLFDNDDSFWVDETILNLNYGKAYYRANIRPDIDQIPIKLQELADDGQSKHGVEREMRKKAFKKHQSFFELLFRHWVNNDENSEEIDKFYKNLQILFHKVAEFHGINPNDWPF